MKIIDAHIHVGLPEFCNDTSGGIPYDLCNTYEDTLDLMGKYGIDQAILLPIPYATYDAGKCNEYIYSACCKYPDRFIPFCRIDDKLEENLAKGFKGVKLHLVYEKFDIDILANELHAIEKAKVPLMIHARFLNKVDQIKQILDIVPDIHIILAHMGRGHLYTGEQVVENCIGLKEYPNVYMDTSTVDDIDALIKGCEILGFDRIIYGSDYPFGKAYKKNKYKYENDVRQLCNAITLGQEELVLYKNVERILYGINV